ncbi:hypothetical protein [Sphingomonas adhaesiva]|uniref:hypothetical protein n=1 Tax=Sphingomonas adhaesiva TaxID=28212 RepID=UPI002FF56EE1
MRDRMWSKWLVAWIVAILPAIAGADTMREVVSIDGAETAVELRLDDGIGELRYRPRGGREAWRTVPLDTLAPIVAVLADQRLAPLWPVLERWAGPDLTLARDAMLTRTKASWEQRRASTRAAQPSQGAVRKPIRALLQYAVALQDAGRFAEAAALLRAQRDLQPVKSEWDRSEWITLSINLANVMAGAGDREGAIAVLEQASVRLKGSPYAINADLNRAAMLAEGGRYEAALSAVEAAVAAFAGASGHGAEVPGARLQFDWIRACALRGLGREAEAATLMASFRSAATPMQGRFAPPADRDVEERGWACLRDPAALAALWQRDLTAPAIGSLTFVTAQPAMQSLGYDPATLDRARRLLGTPAPLRLLPDRYAPALRAWQ